MKKAKTLFYALAGLLAPVLAGALQGPWICQYGEACVLPLEIYNPDGISHYTGTAPNNTADFLVGCASPIGETSGVASVGKSGTKTYAIQLATTDTDCQAGIIHVEDADATAAYLATTVAFETCGNAAATYLYCSSELSTVAATDIVTGGAINTTGGAVDSVTTVATTTTNTDMRGTDGASTHSPSAIVTSGAITTSGGAVVNVTNVATTTTNTDMRGTDNASTHAPTDIVTGGAIATTGGAVNTVSLVNETTDTIELGGIAANEAIQIGAEAGSKAAIDDRLTATVSVDSEVINCRVNTTTFTPTLTTFQCDPEKNGAPIVMADNQRNGALMMATNGPNQGEKRYVSVTVWQSAVGEIRVSTGRAWDAPMTQNDIVNIN